MSWIDSDRLGLGLRLTRLLIGLNSSWTWLAHIKQSSSYGLFSLISIWLRAWLSKFTLYTHPCISLSFINWLTCHPGFLLYWWWHKVIHKKILLQKWLWYKQWLRQNYSYKIFEFEFNLVTDCQANLSSAQILIKLELDRGSSSVKSGNLISISAQAKLKLHKAWLNQYLLGEGFIVYIG